jgi:UDP-hydrolysing UDP-N-acetyl-D-glucosamine 2-epimerase
VASCASCESTEFGAAGIVNRMKKRKICVLTSTRAEYGLLFWLLQELKGDPRIELQILVTGTHLSERFGMTVRMIEADGFPVAARVPMQVEDDTALGVTRSLAQVTIGIGEALAQLCPNLLVLLGDRFEILGAAQAALITRTPVAHIHGGESTEGLIDEAIRHAVTKMSHLHFVAAEKFRNRVIQLGESPKQVWTVGATGLDNIARLKLMNRSDLETVLGIKFRNPFFLFTYHPVTLDASNHGPRIMSFLRIMREMDASIVITGVNADTGASRIRKTIAEFVATCPDRAVIVESMGSLRYLSAVAQADAVVGNSSSGLIEAPALGVATVDIGDRQRGRLRAPSVIHCDDDPLAFRRAIVRALSQEHRDLARLRQTPYGEPGAAIKIAAVIRAHVLDGLLLKSFYSVDIKQTP